jgi:hypothetical protein
VGLRSLQRAQRVCQPDVALRVTVFAAGCTSWPSPGSSRGRRILHWTQHTRGAALCRVALVIAAGSRPRRLRSLCLWPRGRKCRDCAGAMQGRIPPLISSLLLLRRGAGLVWAAFVICLIFAYDEGYWVVSVPFLPRECPCHCALRIAPRPLCSLCDAMRCASPGQRRVNHLFLLLFPFTPPAPLPCPCPPFPLTIPPLQLPHAPGSYPLDGVQGVPATTSKKRSDWSDCKRVH